MQITIRRGRDIPFPGAPAQALRDGAPVGAVALQGSDFSSLRPFFHVEVGDKVAEGQPILIDRRRPEIAFVSPASGTIVALNRGHRRTLDSVVVRVNGEQAKTFSPPRRPDNASVRSLLLESGQWPAFRTRPFERIPDPSAVPAAIFVTAMSTEPLSANAAVVLQPHVEQFKAGLEAIRHLASGPLFVCRGADPGYPAIDADDQVRVVEFGGPHPAGLPGTHIHFLRPAGRQRQVWHICYQDVIAVGHLMQTGRIWTQRVISMAGPAVRAPGLVRTCLGADLNDLLADELTEGDVNVISGSVLSGRPAHYLGRYHAQVTALRTRQPERKYGITASLAEFLRRCEAASIIPIAAYDNVMPLDIFAVPLLRALSIGDIETAESLGCLELAEDDMQLLSHVCPARLDYGALLRRTLNEIEKQM